MALVILLGAGCSGASVEEPGHKASATSVGEPDHQGSAGTTGAPSGAVEQNSADAVQVSSFAGGGSNRAMLVRWEEFGSARLRGEMRLARVAQCSGTNPESTEIDTHRSRFRGSRDRSAVVLDLPARAPGGLGGTWAGELLYGDAGDGSPPGRPALKLEDPDGNQMLLHEGGAQDYADAVARLAENCVRASTGPP